MLKLNNKYIQILSLISIVILLISALFVDIKKDFYFNFLYIRFSEENGDESCKAMSGTIFEINDNQIHSISSDLNTLTIKYAKTLISKKNGTYYNSSICFIKNKNRIYCIPIFKLLVEKMKISRQSISYIPYFVIIILVLLILRCFIDLKEIDIETFILVLLEQIFNYSFFIVKIGFNANFDNCYTSFLFHFYLCFLLLQFFTTKQHKLYFIYFFIIWLSILIFLSQVILSIHRGYINFSFYGMELLVIIVVTIRHFIKILNELPS